MSVGRRNIGAIIGGAGALTCVLSAYLTWYTGSAPHETSIRHLVQTGPVEPAAGYWTSVAAPLAVLGALGALGALIRSRVLLGFAWLVGVTTLGLWALMRVIGRATDQAPAGAEAGVGVWVCVVGLLAVFAGIIVMGPRREEIEAPLSMFDTDPQG